MLAIIKRQMHQFPNVLNQTGHSCTSTLKVILDHCVAVRRTMHRLFETVAELPFLPSAGAQYFWLFHKSSININFQQ